MPDDPLRCICPTCFGTHHSNTQRGIFCERTRLGLIPHGHPSTCVHPPWFAQSLYLPKLCSRQVYFTIVCTSFFQRVACPGISWVWMCLIHANDLNDDSVFCMQEKRFLLVLHARNTMVTCPVCKKSDDPSYDDDSLEETIILGELESS